MRHVSWRGLRCRVPVQGPQPSKDPVCTAGCVLHRLGKPKPSADKQGGLANGRQAASSPAPTLPQVSLAGGGSLSRPLSLQKKRMHLVSPASSGDEGCVCPQHFLNQESLVEPNVTSSANKGRLRTETGDGPFHYTS